MCRPTLLRHIPVCVPRVRALHAGAMASAPALGTINASVYENGLGIISINRQRALNAMNLGARGPSHTCCLEARARCTGYSRTPGPALLHALHGRHG